MSMKKLPNLERVINELNAPMVDEDSSYTVTSPFDFTYRYTIHKYHNVPIIEIYDRNEYYNVYYLEELNYMTYDAAQEFGFEYQPIREDEIKDKLNSAIKKDLGEDKYLEWENSVVMSVSI